METIDTPPVFANISYRYMIETTLTAEQGWESGYTQEKTERLAQAKKLNSFYVGLGMSSAFWLGESSFNAANRTYIDEYGISLMPDFGIGYYLHEADMNIALGYRAYSTSTNTYGAVQVAQRKSWVLEATKYLFDYNGFVPFVGPAVSFENLMFRESFENEQTFDLEERKISYGITFGWDIRPDRVQTFILRTNLRWFPNLQLPIEAEQTISFNAIEFNFIQLILYPNRMKKKD